MRRFVLAMPARIHGSPVGSIHWCRGHRLAVVLRRCGQRDCREVGAAARCDFIAGARPPGYPRSRAHLPFRRPRRRQQLYNQHLWLRPHGKASRRPPPSSSKRARNKWLASLPRLPSIACCPRYQRFRHGRLPPDAQAGAAPLTIPGVGLQGRRRPSRTLRLVRTDGNALHGNLRLVTQP